MLVPMRRVVTRVFTMLVLRMVMWWTGTWGRSTGARDLLGPEGRGRLGGGLDCWLVKEGAGAGIGCVVVLWL